MRKLVSLVLTISLISQALLVPLSVSAKSPTNQSPQQVSALTSPDYQYDATGNLINDGQRNITYDANGMPSEITITSTGNKIKFIYDSNGQRIAKIVKDSSGNTISSTVYFGNLEKEIVVGGATTITKYYFAGGKRIALRKDNGDPVYLHKDHLSSSTLFTDSSGGKKDALLTYFPYGSERPGWDIPSSTFYLPPSNHLYTDQIKDPETNLYYYNARYYNQQTGLFISADTAGDKLNKYTYASNNPIMFNDPSGHWGLLPFFSFIMKAGGTLTALAGAYTWTMGKIAGLYESAVSEGNMQMGVPIQNYGSQLGYMGFSGLAGWGAKPLLPEDDPGRLATPIDTGLPETMEDVGMTAVGWGLLTAFLGQGLEDVNTYIDMKQAGRQPVFRIVADNNPADDAADDVANLTSKTASPPRQVQKIDLWRNPQQHIEDPETGYLTPEDLDIKGGGLGWANESKVYDFIRQRIREGNPASAREIEVFMREIIYDGFFDDPFLPRDTKEWHDADVHLPRNCGAGWYGE